MSRQYPQSQYDRDDEEDCSMLELDSLLESLGPENNNGEDDDDDEAENGTYVHKDDDDADSRGHMVDVIDPDAVDFTPFLINQSGTAINYHNESHMLTEHHEKLRRKTMDLEDLPYSKQSNNNSSSNSSKHSTTKAAIFPGILAAARARLQFLCTQSCGMLKRHCLANSSNSEDEPDRTKYLIYGMLLFLLYVFLRHSLPPPLEGKEIAKVDDIAENSLLPHDFNQAYRNVDDLPIEMMDTPIYWHIPRSGGTTMKLIMSMCMGRVVACEQGAGHQLDEQLELINKPFGNFANVDTSTPMGLQRAAEIGLIPSRIVDVVLTPHVREATKLFDTHHKGRLFALFRNPVERVVSLYYFLRMPDQEAVIGLNVREMTLEQFASDISENWMVRSLTNAMTGPLTEEHLVVAKEMLRTKFLIGLLDEKTESLRRIESYFGWNLPSKVSQTCKNNMFYFEPQSKNIHDPLDPESKEYAALAKRNQYDMDLYEYAVYLFESQSALVSK